MVLVISDCNNSINSIKFTVYLHDDGHGYVKVCAAPGTLPKGLPQEATFDTLKDMTKVMENYKKRIRSWENRIKMICEDCNLGITDTDRLSFTAGYVQDCMFFNELSHVTSIACCPRCKSPRLHKV